VLTTVGAQGIHNIFVVVPQFLVTALSSIIFAIFEPDKSVLHGQHPGKTLPPANTTVPSPPANATVPAGLGLDATAVARAVLLRAADAVAEEEVRDDGVNSVAVIFRIGGVAAIVACVLTWRLARELKRAY
jgi:solute carrier family 45 protein 1/2/4